MDRKGWGGVYIEIVQKKKVKNIKPTSMQKFRKYRDSIVLKKK
jgi:hypothetical protein